MNHIVHVTDERHIKINPDREMLDPNASFHDNDSLDIILLITWLFTKQINNMTQNIDLNII